MTTMTTVLTDVTGPMRSLQGNYLSAMPSSCVLHLQDCLRLVKDIHSHEQADQMYQALRDRLVVEQPDAVELMDMMWKTLVASYQSAALWEKLCQSEQQLTDRMVESHVQLQQSYYRLVQEQ
ncbi:MAG: hypothetical protein F6K09_09450 [Merismopedia sp. SIO2A8]|nr:hypothetical protein [Symploca sp. SIO2B6]NET48934.1 hypothetical protein [Merismopedia sp. SIO2A8]